MTQWITFGKEKDHLQREMEKWCQEKLGEGGWTYETPKTWEGMGDKVWVIHSMFGNTTFAFKNPKHFTLFILRWGLE